MSAENTKCNTLMKLKSFMMIAIGIGGGVDGRVGEDSSQIIRESCTISHHLCSFEKFESNFHANGNAIMFMAARRHFYQKYVC